MKPADETTGVIAERAISSSGFVPRSRILLGYEHVLTVTIPELAKMFAPIDSWSSRPGLEQSTELSQFVYFIGSVRPFVKIGYSTFVPGRLAELQKANPEPLRVLGVMIGRSLLERALHQRFADHWVHGEWFRCDGQLADLLEKAPQ